MFATGRSIEGPTEETIDFLREAGVDIRGDGDDGAKRRGGGEGEAAGVGRVTRTGSRVVTHNRLSSSCETEKRATVRKWPQFRTQTRINWSLCHGYFYSPIDGGFNSAITATPVAP